MTPVSQVDQTQPMRLLQLLQRDPEMQLEGRSLSLEMLLHRQLLQQSRSLSFGDASAPASVAAGPEPESGDALAPAIVSAGPEPGHASGDAFALAIVRA